MVAVDPDDDRIERFVVHHYAYDPDRHERRHRVIAAFDTEREFLALLDNLRSEQQRRRGAGEELDPREHYSGVCLEPGYRRRQRDAHLLEVAMRHGARIDDTLLGRLDLPSTIWITRAPSDDPGA